LPETAWLGDVLVLLNAAGFSWYLIGNQSLMRKYPAFSVMAYQYLISALVALLIFRQETFSLLEKIPALPNDILCLIAYTVFFASIATYTLNNYALKRTTPATVALYIFIQPVLSAVLGHFILHEPFTETMALAGALTLTGVFLATRPVRQTEADLNPLPQE
jgi:drug/metabolite transporter (DMT)-like permease